MHAKWRDLPDVALLVVEQKEPHAGRMAFAEISQPETFAERCELAKRLRDELEVTMPILIDGMDDASRLLFSDLPSPAFLIDPAGTITEKLPWADPEDVERSLMEARARWNWRWKSEEEIEARSWVGRVRGLLANGKSSEAVALVDGKTPAIDFEHGSTDDALVAMTIAEVRARSGKSDDAKVARERALAAVRTIWASDAARRTAALVEIAEFSRDEAVAREVLGEALATLEARAPELMRRHLKGRIEALVPTESRPAR